MLEGGEDDDGVTDENAAKPVMAVLWLCSQPVSDQLYAHKYRRDKN